MKQCALVVVLLGALIGAMACSEASAGDRATAAHCRELVDQPFTNESAAAFREEHPWSRELVTPLIEPPTGVMRANGMSVSTARGLAWLGCMKDVGFHCAHDSYRGTAIECHRGNGAAIRNPFPIPRPEPQPID